MLVAAVQAESLQCLLQSTSYRHSQLCCMQAHAAVAEAHKLLGGGLLHVEMFAHNKSGIAYRDGNRRSETVVNHKNEPHQQPRLLPSCTN
jgi:hypothetical protein